MLACGAGEEGGQETAKVESAPTLGWQAFAGGLQTFGHDGTGFAFDNESPRHRVYLAPFALASRCVTNREYLEFIADGGYARPDLWLSDGWSTVVAQGWQAPLYWSRERDAWRELTLGGWEPLALDAPVVHVSFYEAEAFARWCEARLPSEFEWELAARDMPYVGNFVESGRLHPEPATVPGLAQMFGDEWTGDELRDAQEVMTTIGLWPDGADLLEETVAVEGAEIAGLYSPEN